MTQSLIPADIYIYIYIYIERERERERERVDTKQFVLVPPTNQDLSSPLALPSNLCFSNNVLYLSFCFILIFAIS